MDYVGILLDDNIYRGIPLGKTRYENIAFYEETARMYGLIPCYFRLKDINPGAKEITAYVRDYSNKYQKKRVPMPKVIHNRSMDLSKQNKEHLQSLLKEGIIIFNQWNRYRKLNVQEILIKYEDIRINLPETRRATKANISLMIGKYSKLILKPDSGSLGIGLMKIERHDNENILTMYDRKKKEWLNISYIDEIPEVLKNRITRGNYIVQEYIPLATYKDSPFDLRVSCQKNHLGKWQMTGIACKVAKKGSFVTNVARGGTAHQLGEILEDTVFDEQKITKRIEQAALRIAEILEKHLPGLADVGFDFGITLEGVPKFIECNGRDLRYSFRNANLYDTWKNTYGTPMGYAKFLMDRR